MNEAFVFRKEGVDGANVGHLESYLGCFIFLLAIVLLSYGYELFAFNLTIDEESHAILSGRVYRQWIGQGRWGMALLNYLILPNPILPAVSIFLGLLGTAMGLFLYLRSNLSFDRLGLSVIVALAVTTPTLAFTYTFSTLAYGIGFGFMAISLGLLALRGTTWRGFGCACILSAFAISIYQTFVVALSMFASVYLLNLWRNRDLRALKTSLKLMAYLALSVLLYLMINYLMLRASSLELTYVESYVNLGKFLANPVGRIIKACKRVYALLALDTSLFGEHSCWLGISVLMSIFFSIWTPLRGLQFRQTFFCLGINLIVISLMILPDAISTTSAPIRSLIYIPVAIALLFANAYELAGKVGKRILLTTALLAIIGNSMIINRLNLSSAMAESKDRSLAEGIINTVRMLKSKTENRGTVLKLEIIGSHSWPATALQPKSETFGASFFEWDDGNRFRVADYLSLHGLNMVAASESERLKIFEHSKTMPSWPTEGWITLLDDIVVVKFGDYSKNQKKSLCMQGISEVCKKRPSNR